MKNKMNRLTIKNTTFSSSYLSNNIDKVVDKLGYLEDLQEKIGCPIDIVLNLILGKIDTIYVMFSESDGYASYNSEPTIVNVNDFYDNSSSFSKEHDWYIETNLCDVPLYDYGINWALTKDELENDK